MATKKLTQRQLENKARKSRLAQYETDRAQNLQVVTLALGFVAILLVLSQIFPAI